jgi:hypothetical protein
VVHRVAATLVAVTIAAFGALGLVGGLGFFATEGPSVGGMSTNGALSTISIVTAAVLLVAAARGGPAASTTMIVVGPLFLVSAFANLAVLDTEWNPAGVPVTQRVLLHRRWAGVAAAGGLWPPRRQPATTTPTTASPMTARPQPTPITAGETAADQTMADAERAIAQGGGTAEQRRRIAAADRLRRHEDRRTQWMSSDTDIRKDSA